MATRPMRIERGIRRILIVGSVLFLCVGVLFSIILGVSVAWSARAEREWKTAQGAKGCGPLPDSPTVGLTEVSHLRWRVMIWQLHDGDLRPLLVAPGFKGADHEHRRLFLAASDREFAETTRERQDVILAWAATVTPETARSTSDAINTTLAPEDATELKIH